MPTTEHLMKEKAHFGRNAETRSNVKLTARHHI
jgi:hypothetical protein